MTRQNHILHNPASELELPRLGQAVAEEHLLGAEVERILELCEIEDPIGLRDRRCWRSCTRPAYAAWRSSR